MDVLLPPKWSCSDNVWDLSRCDICFIVLFPTVYRLCNHHDLEGDNMTL